MAKHPYIAFYIGDWLKDPGVKKCSPATKGIWVEFIFDMHESKSGGKLVGDRETLSRIGRCSLAELDHALRNLSDTGTADVYERSGVFTIICRRMKKEAETSKKRANAACKSHANRLQNTEDDIEAEIESEKWLQEPEFEKVWNQWQMHRNGMRKPLTGLAMLKQIQWCRLVGKDRAVAAINHSIKQGWQGIYEPKDANRNGQISRPNPRNEHIIRGPTNYATARTKYDREQEARARALAGQVAPNAPKSPPG